MLIALRFVCTQITWLHVLQHVLYGGRHSVSLSGWLFRSSTYQALMLLAFMKRPAIQGTPYFERATGQHVIAEFTYLGVRRRFHRQSHHV